MSIRAAGHLVRSLALVTSLFGVSGEAGAAAGRYLRDAPTSITALCEEDCESIADRLRDITDLPVTVNPLPGNGPSVLTIRGRNERRLTLVNGHEWYRSSPDTAANTEPQDFDREIVEHGFGAALGPELDNLVILRGPGLYVEHCRSAQAEVPPGERLAVAPGTPLDESLERLSRVWDPRRHRLSSGTPSTPEAFLAGEPLEWDALDAQSPAAFNTLESLNELAAENAGIVYFEEADECVRLVVVIGDTRTYLAGTTTDGGTSEPAPVGPDEFLVPGDDRVPTNDEEEDDEDEHGCCGLVVRDGAGGEELAAGADGTPLLAYPYTTEYLRQESAATAQPARHDVALGAYRVMLHSGSALYPEDPDMVVPRRGFDFLFQRTYAGDMVTDGGGLMGQRWDFSFNKRIVPLPAVPAEEGQYVEPVNARTPLRYSDGRGRSERYEFLSYDRRIVRNFGFAAQPGPVVWPTFVAHVTTYRSPPGAFHEIQRYVLERPDGHPFARHPDVKTELGEAIFYVLRSKEHMQYVFNCRGQLIYVFDAHRNFIELHYDDDKINPLTHNPMLSAVLDTQRGRYDIGHAVIGHGSYLTRHDCALRSASQAPVYAIGSITDPWGRVAAFDYDPQGRLTTVRWQRGAHTQTFAYGYVASGGREHLLAEVSRPADQDSGVPFLTNRYEAGRITQQLVGSDSTLLRYPAPGRAEVEDDQGGITRFGLEEKPGGWVIASREVIDAGADAGRRMRVLHNDDTQVTRVTLPRGNGWAFTYDTGNEPVAVPDSPIRNHAGLAPPRLPGGGLSSALVSGAGGAVAGVNYRNDLSRGNLLSMARVAGSAAAEESGSGATPAPLTQQFAYEPLYNAVATQTDPGGIVDRFEFDYSPGFEGKWRLRRLPDVEAADGTRLTDLVVERGFDPAGSLIAFTGPGGAVTRYRLHATGLPEEIILPEGPSYRIERDSRGNPVLEVPPGGPARRTEFNLRDLAVTIVVDPDGVAATTRHEYDANNNMRETVEQVVDVPAGADDPQRLPQAQEVRRRFEHDHMNRPVLETLSYRDPSGDRVTLATERQFDGRGNLVWERRPAPGRGSVEVEMRYDAAGGLIEERVGDRARQLTYDANGNLAEEVDAFGQQLRYHYDGFDRLVRVTDAADGELRLTLDEHDRLTEEQVVGRVKLDESATRTLRHVRHEYDNYGRRIRTSTASLEGDYGWVTEQWVYGRGGMVIAELDARGGRSETERDALGRPVRRTGPLGNAVELRYRDGRLRQMIEHAVEPDYDAATGQFRPGQGVYVSNFSYDAFGHLRSRQHEGVETRFVYDSRGLVRATAGAGGQWSQAAYDGAGRPIALTRLGRRTRFEYGGSSLPLVVDDGLDREERTYTDFGELATLTRRAGALRHAYDGYGRLVGTTDARGQETRFEYDALGRVNQVLAGLRVERLWRDGLGRVVRAEAGPVDGVTLERRYDGLGRLLSETQEVAGDRQTTAVRWQANQRGYRIEYPAAAQGLTEHVRLDALGRVVQVGAGGTANRYHYAGLSRLAARQSSAGGNDTLTLYAYDQQRRPVGLTHADAQGLLFSSRARFGPHGLRLLEEHFNPAERAGAGSTRRLVTNVHDGLGRVAQRISFVSQRGSPDNNWLHTYSHTYNRYDAHNRLERVAAYSVAEENQYLILDVFQGQDARVDDIAYSADHPAKVDRVRTRVRTERFDVPGGSAAAAWVPWIGRDNDDLPEELEVPPAALAADDVAALVGPCAGSTLCQTKALERDANGNLLSDGLFRFEYDQRNRLVRAEDLHAQSFQRSMAARYVFGPLGRLTARRFELSTRFSPQPSAVYRAFDLKSLRYLYQGQNVVAELQEPYAGDGPGTLLARYVPHATNGGPAQMVRRAGDDTAQALFRFELHYGLSGNVAFVTTDPQFDGGAFARIDRLRYFNGEDAWQLSRQEQFVAGSTTRVPYLAAGARTDSFVGMSHQDGSDSFVYDYRTARVVDLARYGQENWSEIRERIIEQHPKPDAVRQVEYAMAGITTLAALPVAAGAGSMIAGGYGAASAALGGASGMATGAAVDMAVNVGISSLLLRQDVSADELMMSAAIGAVSGGLGRMAAGFAAASVGGSAAAGAAVGMATSLGVDTFTATALEVGLTGADFSEVLVNNAVVGTVGTGIGVASGRLLRAPQGSSDGFALDPAGAPGAASQSLGAQRPQHTQTQRLPALGQGYRHQGTRPPPTRAANPNVIPLPPPGGEPLLARPRHISQVIRLLRFINPGYHTDPLRRNNCQRCTNKVSLLLRGGHALSELRAQRGMPAPGQIARDVERAVCHLDPVLRRGWVDVGDYGTIELALRGAGPYSHGRIWGGGQPGHVWNVWFDGNTVWMIDGQSNSVTTGSSARRQFNHHSYVGWRFLLENF